MRARHSPSPPARLPGATGGAARHDATRWQRAPRNPSCRPAARQQPTALRSIARSRDHHRTEPKNSQPLPRRAGLAAASRRHVPAHGRRPRRRRGRSHQPRRGEPRRPARSPPRAPPPAAGDAWAGTSARRAAGTSPSPVLSSARARGGPRGHATTLDSDDLGLEAGAWGTASSPLAFRPTSWPRPRPRPRGAPGPARRPCLFRRFCLYPNPAGVPFHCERSAG